MEEKSMNGMTNFNHGAPILPILPVTGKQNEEAKLAEDQYKVFVDDEYVGDKAIKTDAESLADIDDFIRAQGFDSFSSSLEGNQYTIKTDGAKEDILSAVNVHLNNR